MTVEEFFKLLLEELELRPTIRGYYKFLDQASSLPFRKAYFCQRLQFVFDQVIEHRARLKGRLPEIWDCGCGYATTQIFLALNGISSNGSTLEFYYNEIPDRLDYWKKHGDMSLVKVNYEDIFETKIESESKDIIIVQDTLHHLEPLQESLNIFQKTLRPGGIVLAVEENGSNLVQRLKLYLRRGNKRIIEFYDEGLGRMVVMGNENIRPLRVWKTEFEKAEFKIIDQSVGYLRLFPPFLFNKSSIDRVIKWEQEIWPKHPVLKQYFYFGLNFIATKPVKS